MSELYQVNGVTYTLKDIERIWCADCGGAIECGVCVKCGDDSNYKGDNN